MAYSTLNPPSLISQRVGDAGGGNLWSYVDGDDLGVVSQPGYFANAYLELGLRAGDEVIHNDTTNGVNNKLIMASHTSGTAKNMTGSAIEPIGESTIALSSAGTGTVVEGDVLEFGTELGVYYHVINAGDADISGGGSLIISPVLTTATAVGTTITVQANVLKAKAQNTANVRDLLVASTLSLSDSGTTFLLNSATEFATTLPVPMEGVNFKFIVKAAPSGANYTIVTSSNATIIQGLCVVNGASVAGADEDTITFTGAAAVVGDWCEIVSDGTNWYVSGQAVAATGITLTDEA